MRLWWVVIVVSMLVGVITCSKKLPEDGSLKLAIRAAPLNFDPRVATDAEGLKIANLIADGLLERGPDMTVRPALAKSYDTVSPTVYIFHLRDDVKFHDGKPFKAEDVVYTYTSIRDGTITSPLQASFKRLKDIVALDDYTVRVELTEPYAPFKTLLVWGIVPVTAKGREQDFNRHPIGTGPYKFIAYESDVAVELMANEDYFGERPKIKRLRLEVVKDDNIRVLKVMKGDVDLVQNGIPPAMIAKVMESDFLAIKSSPGGVVTYMGLNLLDPILKDLRVRKAIAHAIDRGEIIKHQWYGFAREASSLLPVDNWAYNKNLRPYSYDPKKAMDLLDEAAFKVKDNGVRFRLSYKTTTLKERLAIAEMIAHQLARVGIEVRVQGYEWGTFFDDVKKGNYQMFSLSWVGVTEPDLYYDTCHSSMWPPEGANRTRFKNAAVDELEVLLSKLKEINAKVNLIPFNIIPDCPLRPSTDETIVKWDKTIHQAGIQVNIRKSRGSDILAACGQLAGTVPPL